MLTASILAILGPGSGFFDASRHRNLRVVSFNGLPPLIDMSILREIVGFFEESFKRLPDRVEKVRIAVRLVVDWEDEEVRNETLGLFRRAGEILLSRRQSAIVPTLHLFLSNSTPDVWVHGLTTHLAFMETIGKLKIRRFNPGRRSSCIFIGFCIPWTDFTKQRVSVLAKSG